MKQIRLILFFASLAVILISGFVLIQFSLWTGFGQKALFALISALILFLAISIWEVRSRQKPVKPVRGTLVEAEDFAKRAKDRARIRINREDGHLN